MPTYEYVCASCENQWEEIQKISEDPLKVCPKCGNDTAKRQISGGNFILKGGGWYADLYSSAGAKPKAETSGGESKPDASSAKTETTAAPPAKKADSSGGGSSTGGSSGGGSTASG